MISYSVDSKIEVRSLELGNEHSLDSRFREARGLLCISWGFGLAKCFGNFSELLNWKFRLWTGGSKSNFGF